MRPAVPDAWMISPRPAQSKKSIPCGAATRAGLSALGLVPWVEDRSASNLVTAAQLPPGVDCPRVLEKLASFAIEIVASSVALWFTVNLQTFGALAAGSLIMGFAVCGMHYTGMAALHVRLSPGLETVNGADPITFMIPVIVVAFVVLAILLMAVLTGPTREDIEVRNRLFHP